MKLRQTEGCQGEGAWVRDIGEGMCYGGCCEVCRTDESWTCIPETNNILYANLIKKKKKERSVKASESLACLLLKASVTPSQSVETEGGDASSNAKTAMQDPKEHEKSRKWDATEGTQ